MKTRVLITADIEPSIAGAVTYPGMYQPLFEEPVWGRVNGRSEALGFLLDALREYKLSATFFLETISARYFPDHLPADCAAIIAEHGHDVQLHLHPIWMRYGANRDEEALSVGDNCNTLSERLLTQLISEGREHIRHWVGRSPIAMRTGNFAAGALVYRSMERAGITLSSNICTAVALPSEQELRITSGAVRISNVLEIPATCFRDLGRFRYSHLRPLQVAACSFAEFVSILQQAWEKRLPYVVIVTHAFEFLHRQDFAYRNMSANRIVQKRFLKLCEFLDNAREQFDCVTFSQLAEDDTTEAPPVALIGHPVQALMRATQNFVNDRWPSISF